MACIRVFKNEEEGIDTPIICRQCENAPCIEACPTRALARDDRTHAVVVSEEYCIGCGECVEACAFGAVVVDAETHKAWKCDLCGDGSGFVCQPRRYNTLTRKRKCKRRCCTPRKEAEHYRTENHRPGERAAEVETRREDSPRVGVRMQGWSKARLWVDYQLSSRIQHDDCLLRTY